MGTGIVENLYYLASDNPKRFYETIVIYYYQYCQVTTDLYSKQKNWLFVFISGNKNVESLLFIKYNRQIFQTIGEGTRKNFQGCSRF